MDDWNEVNDIIVTADRYISLEICVIEKGSHTSIELPPFTVEIGKYK